jgi:hypothetical protein
MRSKQGKQHAWAWCRVHRQPVTAPTAPTAKAEAHTPMPQGMCTPQLPQPGVHPQTPGELPTPDPTADGALHLLCCMHTYVAADLRTDRQHPAIWVVQAYTPPQTRCRAPWQRSCSCHCRLTLSLCHRYRLYPWTCPSLVKPPSGALTSPPLSRWECGQPTPCSHAPKWTPRVSIEQSSQTCGMLMQQHCVCCSMSPAWFSVVFTCCVCVPCVRLAPASCTCQHV